MNTGRILLRRVAAAWVGQVRVGGYDRDCAVGRGAYARADDGVTIA